MGPCYTLEEHLNKLNLQKAHEETLGNALGKNVTNCVNLNKLLLKNLSQNWNKVIFDAGDLMRYRVLHPAVQDDSIKADWDSDNDIH